MKPSGPKPIWSLHVAGLLAAFAAIAVASLWLRSAFPVFAIGNAGHDDLLFLNLARSIGRGHWLGDYNNLTLAKGMYYSAFISLSHGLGVPLKIAEQATYLCAAGLMTWVVVRLTAKKYLGLILFAVLAFNPVMWGPWLARVIREGLYVSVALTLLALATAAWLLRGRLQLGGWARILVLIALGFTAAAYYLTREEELWLVPALAVLAAYFLVAEWRDARSESRQRVRERARKGAIGFALPAAVFAAVVGSVATVNYARYGVFGTNEFRHPSYLAAYGALTRIRHEEWRRYVFFPKDAREKAYTVSAAARELRPSFEGAMGEGWRSAGCGQAPTDQCPEILGGWWMWALRDAAALAGHYRSGAAALAFYERLASEINEACDDGRLSCLPPRATLAPPLRWHYLHDVLSPAVRLTEMLVCLGCYRIGSPASVGTDEALAFFKRMVGPLARPTKDLRPMKVFNGLVAAQGALPQLEVRNASGAPFYARLNVRRWTDTGDNAIPGLRAGFQTVRFSLETDCLAPTCELIIRSGAAAERHLSLAGLQPGLLLDTSDIHFVLRRAVDRLGPRGPAESELQDARKLEIAGVLAKLYGALTPPLAVLALFGAFAAGVLAWFRPSHDPSLRPLLALMLALVAVVAVRIALLASIDATSFPAVNNLYLSPATPFLLVFVVLGMYLGAMVLRAVTTRRS